MNATHLYPAQCFLGESPFWHEGRKSCFWVDIEGRRLFEYPWPIHPDRPGHAADPDRPADRLQDWNPSASSAEVRQWQFDKRVTLVLRGKDERLLLGMEGGLARFDPETGNLQWLLDIEKETFNHRCNDGAVDSEGRLWVGTLHMDFAEGAGSLYCIGEDMVLHKKMDGLTISNGLVWSPDNTRLYFIDSPRRRVDSFVFDAVTGAIRFEKIAFHIPEHLGGPDGMAIDEEGMLWVAHWGGFGVYRWNPLTGELLDCVKVSAPHVSSCVFGGPSLDHLIISTARQDLTAEQLAEYPQSGDVFVARLPVKGARIYSCKY